MTKAELKLKLNYMISCFNQMRKQRNQAREQYDRVEEERHKAQVSFKDALEFIKALEKENGQLMEQVGSLMFTVEIMQNEINKLQK